MSCGNWVVITLLRAPIPCEHWLHGVPCHFHQLQTLLSHHRRFSFNVGDVNEEIRISFSLNKSVTILVIEPLDCALCHEPSRTLIVIERNP